MYLREVPTKVLTHLHLKKREIQGRLRWFSDVQTMNESRIPKKIMNTKIYATKMRRKPSARHVGSCCGGIECNRFKEWGTLGKLLSAWSHIRKEFGLTVVPVDRLKELL